MTSGGKEVGGATCMAEGAACSCCQAPLLVIRVAVRQVFLMWRAAAKVHGQGCFGMQVDCLGWRVKTCCNALLLCNSHMQQPACNSGPSTGICSTHLLSAGARCCAVLHKPLHQLLLDGLCLGFAHHAQPLHVDVDLQRVCKLHPGRE